MRTALARKLALRCEYEPVSNKEAANNHGAFIFKPYTLFFNQRAWYAIGHHSKWDEVRCMKLNRFTSIRLIDHPYEIPRDFSLKSHLGNAWRMIRGGKTHLVELRFDPAFAETIADTHWHATQEIEWNEDESITFRCRVDGLDEIVWWILGMGPHCQVKKPKELAERVRTLAAQVVEQYSGAKSKNLTKP